MVFRVGTDFILLPTLGSLKRGISSSFVWLNLLLSKRKKKQPATLKCAPQTISDWSQWQASGCRHLHNEEDLIENHNMTLQSIKMSSNVTMTEAALLNLSTECRTSGILWPESACFPLFSKYIESTFATSSSPHSQSQRWCRTRVRWRTACTCHHGCPTAWRWRHRLLRRRSCSPDWETSSSHPLCGRWRWWPAGPSLCPTMHCKTQGHDISFVTKQAPFFF